ncbi:MAG TPA: TadE family protein [Bryobacteraceae bacterium]|nr:TadE family protein [Bryobacteraceae bacterium]
MSHKRRGAALVESALTLPLFVLLWFSLFDMGWIMFFQQTMAYQARSAARYAAVNPGNLTAVQNLVLYNQTSGSGAGVLGLQAANVAVTRTGQGSTEDRINIVISGYQFTLITPGWAGAYTARPISVSIPVEN